MKIKRKVKNYSNLMLFAGLILVIRQEEAVINLLFLLLNFCMVCIILPFHPLYCVLNFSYQEIYF